MNRLFFLFLFPFLFAHCRTDRPYSEKSAQAMIQQWQGFYVNAPLSETDFPPFLNDSTALSQRLAFCEQKLPILQFWQTKKHTPTFDNPFWKNNFYGFLKYNQFIINDLHIQKKQPTYYDALPSFSFFVKNPENILLQKESIKKRLVYLPLHFKIAKQNLEHPTLPHTQVAIHQTVDFFFFLDQDLKEKINYSSLNDFEKKELNQLIEQAKWSVKDFLAFLQSKVNNSEHDPDFRLKNYFEIAFQMYLQTDLTLTNFLQLIDNQQDSIYDKLEKITAARWEGYFPNVRPDGTRLWKIQKMSEVLAKSETLSSLRSNALQTIFENQEKEKKAFLLPFYLQKIALPTGDWQDNFYCQPPISNFEADVQFLVLQTLLQRLIDAKLAVQLHTQALPAADVSRILREEGFYLPDQLPHKLNQLKVFPLDICRPVVNFL